MVWSSQSRFHELLKEFHDLQDVFSVKRERLQRSRLSYKILLLEHYLEGRASWIFDMEAPVRVSGKMEENQLSMYFLYGSPHIDLPPQCRQ